MQNSPFVIFDHTNIEWEYRLLLDKASHRLVLKYLIDVDEKQFLQHKNIDETATRGQCFSKAWFAGKPGWTVPS